MPEIFQYILKASISIAAVYLFYRLLLARLTFYQWNRWYLLGYTVVCFLLPLWNIYGWMKPGSKGQLFKLVPAMHSWVGNEQAALTAWTAYDWLLLVFAGGACIMLIRLLVQYLSLQRMHKRARLLTGEGIKLYAVDHPIIPFSFGMSVFIHPEQHDEDELKEIIRHEMVHVCDHHTVDIIFSEILVALNWFNPFAWLLRLSIRQNLEFIADRQVLAHGLDRRQYQHLLLKVIGQQQFSIASHLNFSALKKRITMMNKIKSARLHLVKFLFALPIIAVLLLAFRNEQKPGKAVTLSPKPLTDTISPLIARDRLPINSKGYYVSVADNQGECIVIIKDKSKTLVKAITLTDWNKDEKSMESRYGKITPPPPPPPAAPVAPVVVEGHPIAPPPPPPPPARSSNAQGMAAEITSMAVENEKITLQLKNGKTENYDLSVPGDKAVFEEKYGQLRVHPQKTDLVEPAEITAPGEMMQTDNEHVTLRASKIQIQAEIPPIYYVDGKPATALDVKAIHPENISQVDVYKGKSALSKYGEKGKYGVISITLKQTN